MTLTLSLTKVHSHYFLVPNIFPETDFTTYAGDPSTTTPTTTTTTTMTSDLVTLTSDLGSSGLDLAVRNTKAGGLSTGQIIGLVVGVTLAAVLLVGLLVFLLCCCCCRKTGGASGAQSTHSSYS